MKISVASEIFGNYPETQIGYVVANVSVLKSHPFVEGLKAELESRLETLGISDTTYAAHPDIAQWRLIYKQAFQVSPSRYRSSVESLVRRVVRGKGIWNISSVVDVYNCASVETLLPMGAYDLEKVSGDIVLRSGVKDEVFHPLGETDPVAVQSNHIVYADDKKVLCHLWNYRDSKFSSIDKQTQRAIFFVDSAFKPRTCPVDQAIKILSGYLEKLDADVTAHGVLNRTTPESKI